MPRSHVVPQKGVRGDRAILWLQVHQSRFRGFVCSLVAVVLGATWIRLMISPSGDFSNHRLWASRFLRGEFLYLNGSNIPYLPFWALAHVPFALLPVRVAATIMLAVAVASTVALLMILDRLASDWLPVVSPWRFWVTTATLALTARFVIRDLTDGGPNLAVVGLVWVGLYALAR